MITIAKLIATIVVGALGSIVGNEAHNSAPRIAHRLIRLASKWYPDEERQDYLDETTDHMDCYTADGLNVKALMVGVSEWRRAALSLGLPSWIRSDNSDRLGIGLVYGLAFGMAVGVPVGVESSIDSGVRYGVIAGLVTGLINGLRFEVVYGVRAAVVNGVGAGLIFGVPGGLASGVAVGVVLGAGFFAAGFSIWFAPILGRDLMVRIRHRLGPS